jgi:hypothetical protein
MAGRIAYYGNIVRDGLVLDLDAAKRDSYPGTGTVWRDIAGGVITGSLVNGPTFDPNNGGSIVFDGVDDLVTVPDNPALNSTSGTINVWFINLGTYSTGAQTAEIINKHTSAGSFDGYGILLNNVSSSVYVRGYIKNTFTNYSLPTGSIILPSIWYNVTLTYQTNSQLILYLNGVSDISRSVGSLTTNTQPLRIGTSNDPFWLPFNGKVATTQIYNRALSASEILQNYNATKGRYGL